MQRIRFVQIGNYSNTVLHNLTALLTRLQDGYYFTFDDDTLAVDTSKASADGSYSTKYLEDLIGNYMHAQGFTERPIGITDLPLPEELVTSSDNRLAIISTHKWESFCSHSIIKGIPYLLASALLDFHITTEPHYETRGCPNDFCDTRSDINIGLERGEFCDACRRIMHSALETGRITQREVTAILRILDYVGGRKICFVLIPFQSGFVGPYESIQAAVNRAGFLCRRADEIFETRSIIQIIYELIGRAEIIVADLTGRNANVFYELGYAHALGKSTILVTQDAEDVPFDLRHRQYVLYRQDDLQNSLERRISAYFS
jgi:hypothetical protein